MNENIIVYKQEIEDGLEDFVRNTKVVSSCSIEICDKFEVEKSELPESYMKIVDSLGDPDLLYYKSILASTGLNKNHHYFLPEILWKAKDSAVYKRTNLEHEEPFIIGSDIRAYVCDFEGKVIDNNTPMHEIPQEFDVVTEGVIYRAWEDPKQQKIVNKVIDGMKNGTYSVSAETAFKNFDYVLIDSDNNKEFIKRTNSTAHLTKYYKERSNYKGKKVGIVFNDMVIVGKGVVKNPANARSKITEIEKKSENMSLDSKIHDSMVYTNIGENENMEYQKLYEDQKLELATATGKIADLTKQVTDLATANQGLNDTVKTVKDSLTEAEKAKEVAVAEQVKVVEVVKASLEEANKVIKEYKDKETFTLRVDSVQTKFELAKEEAVAFVTKFKDFDDTAFTLVVDNANIKKSVVTPAEDKPKLVTTVDVTKVTDALETAKVEDNINPSAVTETKVKSEADKAVEQIGKYLTTKTK